MAIPDLQNVPVLVTGGAGFIGSHLVDALVERGARVTVLDDLSTGNLDNLARRLDGDALRTARGHHPGDPLGAVAGRAGLSALVLGDIREPRACRVACGLDPVPGGAWTLPIPELVFHQAALGSVPRSMADPGASIAVNVAGTANVLAAARDAGVRRVVYASSSSVYGDAPELPKREGHEGLPLSPYALSKAMDEELAELFGRCYQMQLIGLRYFNVYGPRQDPNGPYAAVVPRFFAAYAAGEPPMIDGDGGQTRDFTYVGDAVLANLHSAGAPAAACGRAYNVAPGSRTSVLELARLVRDACGGGPEPVHGEPRPGDVRHSMADATALFTATGFAAEVPLDEGLRRTAPTYLAPADARAS